MKKLFILSLIFTFATVAASAQQNQGNRIRRYRMEQGFRRGPINHQGRFQYHNNQFRYRIGQSRFHRYGFNNQRERMRLMMRNRMYNNRMKLFRQHYYNHRRVI